MSIFYKESGKGDPVVFLHGFCETHEIWDSICDSVSVDNRVILIDLPGFGRSKLLSPSFQLEDIAREIHRFLGEKGIYKFILIGHSLGGYIALTYANLYPDSLSGLGLFHSSAFEDSEEKKGNRDKLIAFVESHGVRPFLQTFIPSLFSPKNIQRLANDIADLKHRAEEVKSESVMAYAAAMRDRRSSIDILKKCTIPVMFILGEDDGSVPLDKSLEQVTFPTNSHFLRLPDTGHMGMYERPNETRDFIKRFIKFCQ